MNKSTLLISFAIILCFSSCDKYKERTKAIKQGANSNTPIQEFIGTWVREDNNDSLTIYRLTDEQKNKLYSDIGNFELMVDFDTIALITFHSSKEQKIVNVSATCAQTQVFAKSYDNYYIGSMNVAKKPYSGEGLDMACGGTGGNSAWYNDKEKRLLTFPRTDQDPQSGIIWKKI
jgi:hypothetical protein